MKSIYIKNACIFSFFLTVLVIGMLIFKDYGVHTDEFNNQLFGVRSIKYLDAVWKKHGFAIPEQLELKAHNTTHGPLLETALLYIQRALHLTDTRDVVLFRHFSCFLVFLFGVYCFYLLCNFYFKNWVVAFIGCVFLVLSPRIFGQSFFDTVDIPFLSFYVFSMYTFLRWNKTKTYANAVLHALACTLLVGIRPFGLIIPLISLLFFVYDSLRKPSFQNFKQNIAQFAVFSWALLLFILITWPILWPDPWRISLEILKINNKFDSAITNLYLGQKIISKELPWHYVPVWLLITTPLIYSFYFVIGAVYSIKILFENNETLRRNTLFLIVCLVLPIYLTKAKTYDSWRHTFFIYPVFLMFTLSGLFFIWNYIRKKLTGPLYNTARITLILLTCLGMANTLYFMVRYHPIQHLYFNRLAGKDMAEVKTKFDLDYWGVSVRQALEVLMKKSPDKKIVVEKYLHVTQNLRVLSVEDRKRFIEKPRKEIKYFITTYRGHKDEFPYKEYGSVNIGNAKIIGIYLLDQPSDPKKKH